MARWLALLNGTSLASGNSGTFAVSRGHAEEVTAERDRYGEIAEGNVACRLDTCHEPSRAVAWKSRLGAALAVTKSGGSLFFFRSSGFHHRSFLPYWCRKVSVATGLKVTASLDAKQPELLELWAKVWA